MLLHLCLFALFYVFIYFLLWIMYKKQALFQKRRNYHVWQEPSHCYSTFTMSVSLCPTLTSCGLLKFLLWPLLSGHLYSAPNIKDSWDKVFFKGHCELNERMDFQLSVIINVSFTFALWTFAYNQSVNLRLEVISHFLNKPIYSALQKSSAICNLCFAFEEPNFLLMLKRRWAIVLKAFRRSFIVFLWTSFSYSLLVQSLLLTFII